MAVHTAASGVVNDPRLCGRWPLTCQVRSAVSADFAGVVLALIFFHCSSPLNPIAASKKGSSSESAAIFFFLLVVFALAARNAFVVRRAASHVVSVNALSESFADTCS